nr:response regulator [uncultured Albidiferax sp.]
MNILLVGTRATPGHDAVLRALLQAWGHQVREEQSGGPADLALLDLDGEVEGNLDTVLAHPLRPALGLASFDHPGTAERCQVAGLHTLLLKPVLPAQLRAALDNQAFDYAQGLTLADPWIVGVIAPQFMQDWPQQLAALEAAMRAADAPTAHRIAHTLKGLVANFQAIPLIRRAQTLEADSATCATPAYQAQVAALRADLGRLDTALAAFCLAHADAM